VRYCGNISWKQRNININNVLLKKCCCCLFVPLTSNKTFILKIRLKVPPLLSQSMLLITLCLFVTIFSPNYQCRKNLEPLSCHSQPKYKQGISGKPWKWKVHIIWPTTFQFREPEINFLHVDTSLFCVWMGKGAQESECWTWT
jgi:hypothetical protein